MTRDDVQWRQEVEAAVKEARHRAEIDDLRKAMTQAVNHAYGAGFNAGYDVARRRYEFPEPVAYG